MIVRVAFSALVLASSLAVLTANQTWGQEVDLRERAMVSFRAGDYSNAKELLERAVAANPADHESHYLLARIYTETPLRDRRAAERALQRALSEEPQNVQYLVANLQQLRTDSWNFFAERVKEIKRLELSRKILDLDPENAFAHEELGAAYIRDFWRYRNAVMIPLFRYGQGRYQPDEFGHLHERTIGVLEQNPTGRRFEHVDPREVFIADHFDLDALRSVGVAIENLSVRADRAYRAAIGHLEQALASDSRRRSVYDHLMRIYALKGAYAEALPMLEEMSVFFTDDPQQWLYRGLSHYHVGNLAEAADGFSRALELMPEEDRMPFESLDLIIPEPERERYLADRSAYTARFWNSKDPRYLTRYNERQLEHFARLVYADLLYSAPDLGKRGWETERGRILVRYGLPRYDVTIIPKTDPPVNGEVLLGALATDTDMGPGEAPSEPRRIRSRLNSDFQLFDDLNTFNVWDYGDFRFVFEDPFRNGEYRLYSPPARDLATGVDGWLNDYQIVARETFRKIPERYEYESPARQIELPFLVNAFKSADGGSDVYVHYGIPIEEYRGEMDVIRVTANTGAFLISGDREIVQEKRRTIYGLNVNQIIPFQETNLWVTSEHLRAEAGTHEVSIEFESASGATVAVQRRAVEIPDFGRGGLVLSDLMLAYMIDDAASGVGPADIERHDLAITPAPWSVFRKDGPIYLYFETYGMTLGQDGMSDYEVEITLTPREEARGLRRLLGGVLGRKKGVSVRYTGSGSAEDEGQYQILDAREVDPGLYTLSLRIRDNLSRRTVSTEKDLYVE